MASLDRKASIRVVTIALIAAALLLVPAGLVRASGPNGTLKGYIHDAGTSAVVSGATVAVSAADVNWDFRATTDGTGFYSIAVPNHLYSVRVTAPAYDMNATSVGVGSGQTVWNNMTLTTAPTRSAVIQGYVKDSVTSAPVTAGQIVATTVWYVSPAYSNASSMSSAGFYRMNVIPGTYTIATSGVAGYAASSSSSTSVYPGQNLWYNFTLTPNPLVAWVNGTVRDAGNSSAIAGAALSASVYGLALAPVQSNATGVFSIHAPVGTVTITADAAGYSPNTYSLYVSGPGQYTSNVALVRLSASIRGWIRDGLTGEAIPGALLVASPFWSTGYFDQVFANANGAFVLNLTPDDFDLAASARGYTSWASYDFLSLGEIVFRNVTLWPIVSRVQGYVLDGLTGAPLAGRSVYATDARSGYYQSALSGASGFYSFAFPPTPAATLRVNGLPPYAGAIAYPDVRPYVTTWVNLTLPRLDAELDVNVKDGLTGLPVSTAYVYASWYLGGNSVPTDASGAAAVAVPSGLALSVYVSKLGYLSWYGTVDPVATTRSLSVVLNPSLATNVTVKGYVWDATSLTGIGYAHVWATGYDGYAPSTYANSSGYYTLSIVAQPQVVRASSWRYEGGAVGVAPAVGGTIWVNFTLATDATSPLFFNFTANPPTNVGPGNPTTLLANINESSLAAEYLSVYKLWSSAGNVGTFLNLAQLPSSRISVAATTPGNSSVSYVYDTHTPLATLTDGTSSSWWPSVSYSPYEVMVSGTFDNTTLPSPVYATASFDTRSGDLLYVSTSTAFIDPRDQPTATFSLSGAGPTVNLTTAAIVGSAAVTGPTFQIGTLTVSVSRFLPGGPYGALLETFDAGSNYGRAFALFSVTADTAPPIARAGPSQTANQHATVTFDGSASTDNVGITSYVWTFTDGTPQVLHGVTATYAFANAGAYLVTLTVRDAAGNQGTSTMTVTVRDTTPPSVALTAPSDAANVSGTVELTATATDNVGVVRVEFLLDGVPIGNATASPYGLALNTATLANGNHTISAVAYDAAGNSASSTRRVTVQNAVSGPGLGNLLGLDLMIWLIFVLILAVGAVIVVLLARRRKRRASALGRPGMTPPPPPDPPAGGAGPGGP